MLTFFDLTNWSELKPIAGRRRTPACRTLKVTQLFSGHMNAKQCHQQFLGCCRRAGREGLDPEVKRQWIELAEAWRAAERHAEAVELAEDLAWRQK